MVRAVQSNRTPLSQGRQWASSIGLERMLRIHFIQHWFNLADPACEEALYDSASLRRFGRH